MRHTPLIAGLLAIVVPIAIWAVLNARPPRHVAALWRRHFHDARRERLFVASVAFLSTFAIVRGITHAIRAGIGPFQYVMFGHVHIHHLVWGIFLLLLVGYFWLVQIGIGVRAATHRLSTFTSLLYGIGAALTLDEFALWLNLEDVYWASEGRESIDAVILFGGMLFVGLWGGPFFQAVGREGARWWRRRPYAGPRGRM